MGNSRKKLDLTGQRYGKLTIIAPAGNVGNRTAWLCRCDCGREIVVKTCRLRSGHTKSCGCQCGPGGPRTALGLTYIDGTCVEMIRANTLRRNNTSGVQGVDWLEKKRRWRATICFKGKRRYLGSYKRFEDAAKARRQAEAEVFGTFLKGCFGELPQSGQAARVPAAGPGRTAASRMGAGRYPDGFGKRGDAEKARIRDGEEYQNRFLEGLDAASVTEQAAGSDEASVLESPKGVVGFAP